MQKVFGVGLNKTGTSSLGIMLGKLGYNHHSYSLELLEAYRAGDVKKVIDFAKDYDSFEDWPWPLMYKELYQAFPDAKFVLTTRKSPEKWLNSLKRHSYNIEPAKNCRGLAYGYDYPLGHEQEHIDFYKQHNQDIRDFFSDKPGQLLEVCWENGDGWKEVTKFLGKKKPKNAETPHVQSKKASTVPLSIRLQNHLLARLKMFAGSSL